MKRFFTSFLALLLGTAATQAQVSITCDGREIRDGDTLTFYAYEIADEFGTYDTPEAGPAHAPLFRNTSDAAIERLSVSVTTSENCADAGIYWCGFTGECKDVQGGKETREFSLPANGVKTMDMHGRFTLKDYRTYTVDVVVSIGGQRLLSFVEVFVYDQYHATGIAPVTTDGRIRYADGALLYDFATAAPRRVSILAPDGRCIVRATTATKSGSVGLGTLAKGTYLYSVEENGRTTASGKFVSR